jgi:uncharacterized membrane protein
MLLIYIFIGFFALVGFAVSGYIFLKKQKHEKLVCFMGDDCNKVVNSKYNSLFFGIPNEVMGLGYYALVFFVAILLFLGVESIGLLPIAPLFLVGAGASALFAVYLLYAQYFLLKEWCEYCLTSAIASIAIFILFLLYAAI